MRRTLLSIGLLSLSLLAFQLTLMVLLSLMQWHHFAGMVIALALLGFGASGTLLAVFREWAHRHVQTVLPGAIVLAGVFMPLSVALAQVKPVRFDSLTIFADPSGIVGLSLTAVLVALPFFFGALAIGLALAHWPSRSSVLYFSTMAGSGLGTILALVLMWWVEPPRLSAICGACAVASGWLLATSRRGRQVTAAALLLTAWFCVHPFTVILSEFKAAAAALRLPEARITYEAPSPEGVLQQVSAPALRSTPALSLTYTGDIPSTPVVFCNGEAVGAIFDPADPVVDRMLGATTFALPYALQIPRRVLVADAGSGVLVVQALAQGVASITAAEENGRLLSLVRAAFDSAALRRRQSVEIAWRALSPRNLLAGTAEEYDLIIVPPVGVYGGGAGLSALHEEYTLTVESFQLMWHRLSPRGLLCLTAWMDYPPRAVLKLAGTLAAMASREGIELESRLVAVRGWGTVTFVLSRSVFGDAALARVRAFSASHGFDPLLLGSGLTREERMHYHTLQDTTLFASLDEVLRGQWELVEARTPFRIRPAVDDRPYFHQFLRLDRVKQLSRLFGDGALPYVEAGYAVILLTAGAVLLMALLLVGLPVLLRRTVRGGRSSWGIVVAGLGAGYMVAEIALIQQCVPLLGSTVSSAGIVMGTLLVSSGAGSLYSSRLPAQARTLVLGAGASAGLLTGLLLMVSWILPLVLPLALWARVAASMGLVALPGFFMGMPFPLSLRMIGHHQPANIPWIWAVNGVCSVAGAACAPVLALEYGTGMLLALAAGAYLLVLGVAAGRVLHDHRRVATS